MKPKTKFKRIHDLENDLKSHTDKKVGKEVAEVLAAITHPEEKDDVVNLARYIHNAKRQGE